MLLKSNKSDHRSRTGLNDYLPKEIRTKELHWCTPWKQKILFSSFIRLILSSSIMPPSYVTLTFPIFYTSINFHTILVLFSLLLLKILLLFFNPFPHLRHFHFLTYRFSFSILFHYTFFLFSFLASLFQYF